MLIRLLGEAAEGHQHPPDAAQYRCSAFRAKIDYANGNEAVISLTGVTGSQPPDASQAPARKKNRRISNTGVVPAGHKKTPNFFRG